MDREEEYTKLYDWVVEEVGLYAALVYSVIRRYESMRKGKCYASMARLCKHVGMSRSTFCEHLQLLRRKGLVKDLTPGLRNIPHDLLATDQGEYKRKKSGLVLRG